MDLNQVPNDPIVNELNIDDKKVGNFDDVVKNELGYSRVKIDAEEERLGLESEIWNKYLKLEAIKAKIRVLGDEKLGIEDEIKELKRKKGALGGAADVGGDSEVSSKEDDEMSRIAQLAVDNKVLESDKNDVIIKGESWEERCKDFGLRMLALIEGLKSKDKVGGEGGFSGTTAVKGDSVCGLDEAGASACLPGAVNVECPIEAIFCAGTPDKPSFIDVARLRKRLDFLTVRYGAVNVECPVKGTPDKPCTIDIAHLRKRLDFQNVRYGDDKIAPPTPEDGKPSAASVIDIADSDNEGDVHARNRPSSQSERNGNMMLECDVHDIDGNVDGVNSGEEQNGNRVTSPSILTPNTKRKRDLKVVTSDDECEDYGLTPNRRALKIENSDGEDDGDNNATVRRVSKRVKCESDDDDDIPISKLIKRPAQQGSSQPAGTSNSARPKRRLVKCGQSEDKDEAQQIDNDSAMLETENAANDESSDEDSESSVRSLSNFIVDDDDVENDQDDKDVEKDVLEGDDGDDSYEVEEGSDDNVDFEEIISKLQSRRHPNSKWTSEADMLSDFGKNPELCLKAVDIASKPKKKRHARQASLLMGEALANLMQRGEHV